jgi:hypothetical protein
MASTPPTHVGATVTVAGRRPIHCVLLSSQKRSCRYRSELDERLGEPGGIESTGGLSRELSATKARHRGDHRRHRLSRHASLAHRVQIAPNPSRALARSPSFFPHLTSTPRQSPAGVDSSDPRGRDGGYVLTAANPWRAHDLRRNYRADRVGYARLGELEGRVARSPLDSYPTDKQKKRPETCRPGRAVADVEAGRLSRRRRRTLRGRSCRLRS